MQKDDDQRLNVNMYGSNDISIHNNVGTDDNTMDSLENSSKPLYNNKGNSEDAYKYSISIFRYKFSDEFMKELYIFSKIHEYDNRKDFKDAWEIWVEDQNDMVTDEIRRLTNLGYEGDIMDKMYKSARYYFRKKTTEKKTPQKRCSYTGVEKEILDKMDEHIKTNITDDNYKPSIGFDNFCQENLDILKEEINNLLKNGITDPTEIKKKIKKTYQNRYFIIVNKK